MSDRTGIAWTDHTFNPWWGCAKVSPGCDHCYAERDAGRYSPHVVLWGVDAARRVFADKHWQGPLRWNTTARKEGRRHRVFCASMADVFDNHEVAEETRPRLWQLIRETPYLDWQILTKRIGNAKRMLPDDWGRGYPNVWLGASIVNQEEANRDIPKLLETPAAVSFLSCEPLLEEVTIFSIDGPIDVPGGMPSPLHWVIVGGESGPKARPFNLRWARSLVEQCAMVNVACFVKQLGTRPVKNCPSGFINSEGKRYSAVTLKDRAGGDMAEWPEDLRIRCFPEARC